MRAAWRFLHWGYAVLHPDHNAIFQIWGRFTPLLLGLYFAPPPLFRAQKTPASRRENKEGGIVSFNVTVPTVVDWVFIT